MFILYILINAYIKFWSFSPHFTSLSPLIIEDFFLSVLYGTETIQRNNNKKP